MAVVCDVTKPEQVKQSLERVAETLGVPDVLVNNAGIGLHKFCLDFTPEEWLRVNAVSSGYIFTELTAKRPQELRDDWASRTPQKRLGVPDDLAAAYIYLASDSARYTTGSNIAVDGGYTLI